MPNSTRLFLIRHGEVEEKYHRIFGGRIDMDLSPTGLEQARAMANHLREVHLDAIYVSPMRRANRTAAAISATNGHVPIVADQLREVDFGVWTGLRWEEVKERYGVSAFDWLAQLERGVVPEAESLESFAGRVRQILKQVLEAHAGQRVALVCHGGVVRMLLAQMLELPLARTVMFEIDYASVSVVDKSPGGTEIQLLNYTPWRPNL
jgi:broad specificity phosphatase PhoE